MYIFELLVQIFKGRKKIPSRYNPLEDSTEEIIDDSGECNHMFLPLDSSQELFACKYCGLIVPKEKLKDMNIFRNKSI